METLGKQFETTGYISGLDVMTKDEVQKLRNNFQCLQDKTGEENAQYSLHNQHMKDRWVLELAAHPKLLEAVSAILGPNIILLDSRFICKYPEVDSIKYVAWHQDVKYWGVDGDVVSAWLAVDDADEENGCLLVIPGSHKDGLLEHRSAIEEGNLLSANQEIPEHLYDASRRVACPLKAGQASLHHGHLVHGSEPNRSERRRCGYVIRYVSTEIIPVEDPERPRKFEATMLLSGKDTHQNFKDNAPAWLAQRRHNSIIAA